MENENGAVHLKVFAARLPAEKPLIFGRVLSGDDSRAADARVGAVFAQAFVSADNRAAFDIKRFSGNFGPLKIIVNFAACKINDIWIVLVRFGRDRIGEKKKRLVFIAVDFQPDIAGLAQIERYGMALYAAFDACAARTNQCVRHQFACRDRDGDFAAKIERAEHAGFPMRRFRVEAGRRQGKSMRWVEVVDENVLAVGFHLISGGFGEKIRPGRGRGIRNHGLRRTRGRIPDEDKKQQEKSGRRGRRSFVCRAFHVSRFFLRHGSGQSAGSYSALKRSNIRRA